MKTIRYVLPAVCITGIIAVILLFLYRGIYNYAEDKCWQELSDTAEQLTGGIAAEFEDDVAKLHIMGNILQNHNLEDRDCLEVLYLDTVLPTTMFSRIDVWFPDNMVVSSGTKRKVYRDYSFEKVAADGEHMTGRKTDPCSGNETVYYLLPITENDDTLAIMVGVIDLSEIADRFRPVIYDGKGQICVVDSADGSFIIDSWHDELGNVYDLGKRKMADGYEDVDVTQKIKNLETGVVVFESKTTGEPLYMYFTPVDLFDWQFIIFAEKDTIFEYLLHLSRYIIFFGILVAVLAIVYFAWNMNTVRLLKQKVDELEDKKELLKQLSYKDALTSIYNRTKYREVWKSLEEKSLEHIGVAYLDLNGLKQINDSKSHDEGDKYICNAADILFEVFPDDCYRIGGDEFVVLSADTDKDKFKDKTLTVRKLMQESKISISMGFCWKERCDNLKEMRKEAEEQMYSEKETYYRTHDRRDENKTFVT